MAALANNNASSTRTPPHKTPGPASRTCPPNKIFFKPTNSPLRSFFCRTRKRQATARPPAGWNETALCLLYLTGQTDEGSTRLAAIRSGRNEALVVERIVLIRSNCPDRAAEIRPHIHAGVVGGEGWEGGDAHGAIDWLVERGRIALRGPTRGAVHTEHTEVRGWIEVKITSRRDRLHGVVEVLEGGHGSRWRRRIGHEAHDRPCAIRTVVDVGERNRRAGRSR